jgi:hypothetical protein
VIVFKRHIKSVSRTNVNTVCINIGEGPLKNIYIKSADVIAPVGMDAEQLRDWLASLLNTSSSGTGSTSMNQLITLQAIKNILLDIKLRLPGGQIIEQQE